MSLQYDGVNMRTPSAADGVALQNLSANGCYLKNAKEGDAFNLTEHGCIVQFTLQEDMKAPIMVYYQLDNFYQNHRRYVSSRSDAQLRGDVVPPPISTCTGSPGTTSLKYNSTDDLAPGATAAYYRFNPCGLIANSLFNGTHTRIVYTSEANTALLDLYWINSITTPDGKYLGQTDTYNGKEVVNLMEQSGLAWQSDIEIKFHNPETLSSEDMMLWQNPKYRFVIPSRLGQERILNVTGWTTPTPLYGASRRSASLCGCARPASRTFASCTARSTRTCPRARCFASSSRRVRSTLERQRIT